MEIGHVIQLAQVLCESLDEIEQANEARLHYLELQKQHDERAAQRGGSKCRATGSAKHGATGCDELPALSQEGAPSIPRSVADKVLGYSTCRRISP